MNKLIEDQLTKVTKADLSHFDEETYTYTIPKKMEIKLEENVSYLLHLKDSCFYNEVLKNNWNKGSVPTARYIQADISKVMPHMVRVVSIEYDPEQGKAVPNFWSGWLSLDDIEVLARV